MFNENRKPGIESERNWGLFFPDRKPSNVVVMIGANNTSANGTWCVASTNASETDLQNALNWACGPGIVDCSAIQPSQPCYQPDTLASHASYAFNSYYQQNGANVVACQDKNQALNLKSCQDLRLNNHVFAQLRQLKSVALHYKTLKSGIIICTPAQLRALIVWHYITSSTKK